VEDDVDVWRYAILQLHARNDDDECNKSTQAKAKKYTSLACNACTQCFTRKPGFRSSGSMNLYNIFATANSTFVHFPSKILWFHSLKIISGFWPFSSKTKLSDSNICYQMLRSNGLLSVKILLTATQNESK